MPLGTHINRQSIQNGLNACRKKLAATSRRLLLAKLEEIDRQTHELARYRAHIQELLSAIPEHSHESSERTIST